MKRSSLVLLAAFFCTNVASIAFAQAPPPVTPLRAEGRRALPPQTNASVLPQRTFVSSTGSDAAACLRTAPCRNFAAAVAAVAAGGEVIVLDSAGYGTVVLNKSVSIIAPAGVYAGVSALAGSVAIQIYAADVDSITIRGLSLNGLGGQFGVYVFSANDVHIQNCFISGFTPINGKGIYADAGTAMQLYIADTTVQRNETGIALSGTSAPVVSSIARVNLAANSTGLYALDNTQTTVTDSIASGGGNVGFQGVGGAVGTVLNLVNCTASNNPYGVASQGTSGTFVRLSRCHAFDNSSGGFAVYAPAVMESLGDNVARGGGPETIGTLITITPH